MLHRVNERLQERDLLDALGGKEGEGGRRRKKERYRRKNEGERRQKEGRKKTEKDIGMSTVFTVYRHVQVLEVSGLSVCFMLLHCM